MPTAKKFHKKLFWQQFCFEAFKKPRPIVMKPTQLDELTLFFLSFHRTQLLGSAESGMGPLHERPKTVADQHSARAAAVRLEFAFSQHWSTPGKLLVIVNKKNIRLNNIQANNNKALHSRCFVCDPLDWSSMLINYNPLNWVTPGSSRERFGSVRFGSKQ